ncbi:tRNA-uridine aminocarboxypropyltransferase [Gilvimarinus sp. DA14]|uniref:tRNA-uridine aminocarboxypropyltransferase n=1 Tax=Gilvimarinus sp. DA14 TaxID=2956798 RepID=UPI0020B7B6D5|nr:DTW domain-containing protein [Gilvimarinus sp. DA14]
MAPTENHTFALILQHPDEAGHPKNTGELLHRSLQNSQLLIGEQFRGAELNPFLENAVLLYPETADYCVPVSVPGTCPDTLVIIDANWRKSRKMLFLNPALGALPRLSITSNTQSNYRIRQAKNPHQLSTLEASCYALQQLESSETKYLPLLHSFDRFIDKLVSYDPNRS